MRAAISTTEDDPAALLERVLASPPMEGADLAREVSTPEPYVVAPPDGTAARFRPRAGCRLGNPAPRPRTGAGRDCPSAARGSGPLRGPGSWETPRACNPERSAVRAETIPHAPALARRAGRAPRPRAPAHRPAEASAARPPPLLDPEKGTIPSPLCTG